MTFKTFFALCFFALALMRPAAIVWAESPELTGYIRNYTGMLLEDDNEYSIVQNTFNLNFHHSKSKVSFKVNPYLYHYFDTQLEMGLRQAYMDIYFDSVDFRIGKQQIIWGKADGVFITDIVSPKDLGEFLLPDFDEIRIGINSVKADYYMGNNTFEFVWVPVFTPTQMPEKTSIWSAMPPFPIGPIFDYSQKEAEDSLKNSEIFVKYSTLTSLLDFELMAGYMWDDDPAMHITKTVDPSTGQVSSLVVTPRHHRLSLAGGSFSTTLFGLVLRGEGAFYNGKRFSSLDPQHSEGLAEKNYLHYLAGIDYNIWGIRLSGQFIQQVILDYEDQMDMDEFDNTMTLLASKDFLRETLRVELFSYIGLNNQDALIRPKITYDLSDGFEVIIGANLFVGSEGRFGQYNDNDMIYTKVKYNF